MSGIENGIWTKLLSRTSKVPLCVCVCVCVLIQASVTGDCMIQYDLIL